MSNGEQELTWKLNYIREEINLDLKKLASKDLSADQRIVIREHLHICNSSIRTLKDVAEKNRAASQKSKLENQQRLNDAWKSR